jgi:hypothetical protein
MTNRSDHRGEETLSTVTFDIIATGLSAPSQLSSAWTEDGYVHMRGLTILETAVFVAEGLARHGHPVEVVAVTQTTVTSRLSISLHRPEQKGPCGQHVA